MKYHHDQHIGVYENAISDGWCDKVIEYFEKNIDKSKIREGVFGAGSVRDTSLLLNDPSLIQTFHNFFSKCFTQYQYIYPAIPHPLNLTDYKIQKTLPTEGYHPYHIEQGPGIAIRRIAAYTVYLNNIEEGGETEFLYQLKRIKPKKGTICIFPAGYTHVHRGNTPFSGEKYIMTGWLELPKENQDKIGS